jgi:hypothetical protein
MDSELIKEICNGNINKLKQIPKSKINHLLLSELLTNMEYNKNEIKETLNVNEYSCDNKYSIIYKMSKINDIDECITYLKKIT